MNGDKIIVGPVSGGLKTTNLPFFIDNDSFPVLINAYQWRGRVKRKRGTSLLGRIKRYFNSEISSYSASATMQLNGSGVGNLLTGFGLESGGNIVPATAVIFDVDSGQTYRDLLSNGFLTPTGTGGVNTIDYATGVITIPGAVTLGVGHFINAEFIYYPNLPVMGLEDFNVSAGANPGNISFNTTRSFNINTTSPYDIYDISFYKNLAADGTAMPGYVPKTDWTGITWNGQNYQQFWTTNYQGGFWATNGVTVPFNPGNMGMQFGTPSAATWVDAITMQFTIVGNPLVVGDLVFVNEWVGSVGGDGVTLNFQTGYVTVSGDVFTVVFPFANISAGNYASGIVQYLTNRSDVTKDCIRWYDGDPTDANPTAPTLVEGKGWVNFMPPLSRDNYSIADLPALKYYLVGAKLIQQFKDRLLFIGPVVQTSTGTPIYLQDVVVYSQNGTAFYTASFDSDPSLSTTTYKPLLVPTNQTATPNAYWSDQTGFGGWIQAGTEQPIITTANNEDVLILGCPTVQIRFVYTGNDFIPFNFFSIDTDLSTTSTFSVINMGSSVVTRGFRGLINTTQRQSDRIDLDILGQNFEVKLTNNGDERYTAQRDYLNEWIYFTYTSNQNTHVFPNQTLFYNYRDKSWAIFNESYTTYGQFRKRTGFTWATVGSEYPTWQSWDVTWNSGASTLLSPEILAGNAQGFIMIRDAGTGEGKSLYIQGIVNATREITSPNHCLNENDYIVISDVKGVTNINGRIFKVGSPVTQNTFVANTLNQSSPFTGTYIGAGLIKRMYVPFIQTKQFPVAWGMGRKTRIGVQKFLLNRTNNGQITLLIYLSTDSSNPYNAGTIYPGSPYTEAGILNSSLIYSTVLFTCPESTNLGLTPADINLQMINSGDGKTTQQYIWHRINTSLIGDTVQLGFTLSDSQMRDISFNNQFVEIELNGFILDVYPSQLLC